MVKEWAALKQPRDEHFDPAQEIQKNCQNTSDIEVVLGN
jgi:hypothetical protein